MKKTIDSNNGVVRFSFKDPIHILEASKKKESLIFLHFSYGRRFKSLLSDKKEAKLMAS